MASNVAIPGSFQRIVVSTSPVGLTPPTTGAPRYAIIQCRGNDVVYQDDGTTVTANNSQYLAVGGVLKYDADLLNVRFLRAGGADGEIRVSYYSN